MFGKEVKKFNINRRSNMEHDVKQLLKEAKECVKKKEYNLALDVCKVFGIDDIYYLYYIHFII